MMWNFNHDKPQGLASFEPLPVRLFSHGIGDAAEVVLSSLSGLAVMSAVSDRD